MLLREHLLVEIGFVFKEVDVIRRTEMVIYLAESKANGVQNAVTETGIPEDKRIKVSFNFYIKCQALLIGTEQREQWCLIGQCPQTC